MSIGKVRFPICIFPFFFWLWVVLQLGCIVSLIYSFKENATICSYGALWIVCILSFAKFLLLVLYFFLSNLLHYCCCCWSHLLFKANGTIAVMFLCGQFANFCSWNCGHEGPTSDPAVIETRIKQVTPSSIYHLSTWSLFLILALPL